MGGCLVNIKVFTYYYKNKLIYLQEEIEQRCPQALDLGLVKLVGNHVLFHCQPPQELNAAKHIVQRLETAVNIRVNLNYSTHYYYSYFANRNAQ